MAEKPRTISDPALLGQVWKEATASDHKRVTVRDLCDQLVEADEAANRADALELIALWYMNYAPEVNLDNVLKMAASIQARADLVQSVELMIQNARATDLHEGQTNGTPDSEAQLPVQSQGGTAAPQASQASSSTDSPGGETAIANPPSVESARAQLLERAELEWAIDLRLDVLHAGSRPKWSDDERAEVEILLTQRSQGRVDLSHLIFELGVWLGISEDKLYGARGREDWAHSPCYAQASRLTDTRRYQTIEELRDSVKTFEWAGMRMSQSGVGSIPAPQKQKVPGPQGATRKRPRRRSRQARTGMPSGISVGAGAQSQSEPGKTDQRQQGTHRAERPDSGSASARTETSAQGSPSRKDVIVHLMREGSLTTSEILRQVHSA